MPDPAISPTTLGQLLYTITDSDGAIVDLSLNVGTTPPFPSFSVRYPTASAVQVTLFQGIVGLSLLPGPIDDNNATFANRRVIANTTPAGGDTVLSCEIRATSGAALDAWSVRVEGLGGGECQFTAAESDDVTRVMCDPVATFSIAPGTTIREQSSVTLTASPATGPAGAPTVVGAPAPTVSYAWSYDGDIAITAFPACGAGQVFNFTAPGVYGEKVIDVTLEAWFDGDCPPDSPGFLINSSAPTAVTIEPRPQHLMLVADRSGSMSGDRWENAKTAARILTHLFVALRTGVEPADRVGITVFEDASCTWHAAPIDPLVALRMPLNDTGAADAQICDLDFGTPGSCTPIGDGLYKAMEFLNGLGVADDPRFTIILLTDGYENSGTIKVDPNSTAAAGIQPFSTKRNDFPNVNSRLTIFAVGLGSTVQEDVLDALTVGAGNQGIYRFVTDVGLLQEAIAQMVSMSQEAQQIVPMAGLPATGDPSPPAGSRRYFEVESGVNRLALAVEWDDAADDIELAFRAGTSGPFTLLGAGTKHCPTHGFVTVDVAALFGGEASVPATEWRVGHCDDSAVVVNPGDDFPPIADDDLLIFVDLLAKADISFDKTLYRTGDPLRIEARLRFGNQPITGAQITVELARPGESLGTFLGTNGQNYDPGRPARVDPAHPKQAMLQQLLRQNEMDALPILKPASFFADGTNRLFDDGSHQDGAAGDGNYANTFTRTDKEGTYTFRFFIQGTLPDGSPFNRLITISRWVGVNVDPFLSTLALNFDVGDTSQGFQTAQVVFNPVDRFGNLLGPFRPAEVSFQASSGRFQGSMVSNYDGTYSQVLVYPRGSLPTVTVKVQGKTVPPVVVAPGCLGQFFMLLRSVWTGIRRLLGGPRP